MLPTLHPVEDTCPWCGEPLELSIDASAGSADYVEDCQVCCAPILVRVRIDDAQSSVLSVHLEREGG